MMHTGIYINANGYHWFAAAKPSSNIAPPVDCLRGQPLWYNDNGVPTGCLGSVGDLHVSQNHWTRFQIVTYGDGQWIFRVADMGTGERVDVAVIRNPYTEVTQANTTMENVWIGDVFPGEDERFYINDFKYRINDEWAQMPSNIGGDFGANHVWESNSPGSDVCPQYYGVTGYISGSPYLWYMGSGGIQCSGLLSTGGGPETSTTSLETTWLTYLSSNNGESCITSDRRVPGQWEEWHRSDLGNSIFEYRGNNGRYMIRHSNDILWEDTLDTSNINAKFEYIPSFTQFKLKNLGNSRFIVYPSGTSSDCVRASGNTFYDGGLFRYVAW